MSCSNSTSSSECPVPICADQYLKRPQVKRMRIFGADGRCLKEFNADCGFVVGDGSTEGQFITNRPRMNFPWQKQYQTGVDGILLTDGNGRPVEADPGVWDSMVALGEDGYPNRIQGQANVQSRIRWDGCQYQHVPIDPLEGTMLHEFEKAPENPCDYKDAVLVLSTVTEVRDGKVGEIKVAKLGYKDKPTIPLGVINAFAGPAGKIPTGWRACNGDSVGIANYPDLFEAIGYSWGGAGDFFRLPDLRGQFLRGHDDGAAVDPDTATRTAKYSGGNTGNAVGTYQEDAIQCHGHEGSITGKTLSTTSTTTTDRGARSVLASASLVDGAAEDVGTANPSETDCGVPRTSMETRGKNAYVNWIIWCSCDACP